MKYFLTIYILKCFSAGLRRLVEEAPPGQPSPQPRSCVSYVDVCYHFPVRADHLLGIEIAVYRKLKIAHLYS